MAFLTFIVATATASAVEITPLERPLVLSGRHPTAAFVFESDEVAPGEAFLSLELEWARRLAADRSFVTVRVDGQPLSTLNLDERGLGTQKVPLPELEAGEHVVELVATLWIDGDPCLFKHGEHAWLRVLETTRVSVPQSVKVAGELGVAAVVESWVGRSEPLVISTPERATAGHLAALLELEGLAVQVNVGTRLQRDHSSPDIVLRSGTVAELSTPRVEHGPVAAIVPRSDGRLVIVGVDAPSLADASYQLSLPEWRSRCPRRGVCWVDPAMNQEPDELDEPSVRVIDLTTIGMRQGWTARGPGRHQLKWVWNRPPSWNIAKGAGVELVMQGTDPDYLDPDSGITVSINGRPLATWRLHERVSTSTTQTLRVRVPESFWEEPAWVVDIDVFLVPSDDEACESETLGGVWLSLDPTSGLHVPREELDYGGIASFFAALTERPALESATVLAWSEAHAWASILAPLTAKLRARPWRLNDSEPDDGGPRIRYVSAHRNRRARSGTWSGFAPSDPIPRLKTAGTVWVGLEGSLLSLTAVPEFDDATYKAMRPDVRGWVGSEALLSDGRWFILNQAAAPLAARSVTRGSTSNGEVRAPEQAKLIQRIDTVWLILALALIGFMIWRWRRFDRTEAPSGLAIEQLSAKEKR
ncbi:MAG: cellulose biosynthesis cyclic di-GMP-binding regulatory protein BcsB [Myxococcota bacterium]